MKYIHFNPLYQLNTLKTENNSFLKVKNSGILFLRK